MESSKLGSLFEEMQNQGGTMYVDDNGEWKLKEDKNLWHIIFRSIRKESRLNKLKDAIDRSLS